MKKWHLFSLPLLSSCLLAAEPSPQDMDALSKELGALNIVVAAENGTSVKRPWTINTVTMPAVGNVPERTSTWYSRKLPSMENGVGQEESSSSSSSDGFVHDESQCYAWWSDPDDERYPSPLSSFMEYSGEDFGNESDEDVYPSARKYYMYDSYQ